MRTDTIDGLDERDESYSHIGQLPGARTEAHNVPRVGLILVCTIPRPVLDPPCLQSLLHLLAYSPLHAHRIHPAYLFRYMNKVISLTFSTACRVLFH